VTDITFAARFGLRLRIVVADEIGFTLAWIPLINLCSIVPKHVSTRAIARRNERTLPRQIDPKRSVPKLSLIKRSIPVSLMIITIL
jgi:hypothetical protein